MKKKILYLIIIILTVTFSNCAQTEKKENIIKKVKTNEKSKNSKTSLEPQEFLLETSFNINGISLINKFNLETYIDRIGRPDKLQKGGQEIIDEFGYDDYDLLYSKNRLEAGHGQLLSAYIFEPGISFNGIEIGNTRKKIELTFKIETLKEKSIRLVSRNDHILNIVLNKDGEIIEMTFYSPI